MRTVLLGLLGAAMAVTGLAVPAISTADAAPAPTGATTARRAPDYPLRLATYNIRSGVSVDAFKRAVGDVRPQADVIGLQEIGAAAKNLYLSAGDPDWGYFIPPKLRQNPVIWRRDLFDLRGVAAVKIADGRSLDGEQVAASREVKKDSYATVVRLTDRATGTTFSVINVHLANGAITGGLPTPGKPRLYGLFKDQVAGTVAAVKAEKSLSDRVYLLGDFNVGFKADLLHRLKALPYRRFTKLGLTSMWAGTDYLDAKRGTHSKVLIDQIWSTARPSSVAIDYDAKVSDHFPALATYALAPPSIYYTPPVGSIGFAKTRISAQECDQNWQHPTFHIPVVGDLTAGYVRDVELDYGTVKASDVRDVDTSDLFDADPATNELRIEMWPNTVPQRDRSFTVTLKDPVNTTLGNATVTLTVLDDDYARAPNCKAPGK